MPSEQPVRNTIEQTADIKDKHLKTRHEEFYSNAPIAFLTLDSAGHILDANAVACQELGISSAGASDFIPFSNFVHADSKPLWLNCIDEMKRAGGEIEIKLQQTNGSTFDALIKCTRAKETGHILMVIADTNHNLREAKNERDELLYNQKELRRLVSALSLAKQQEQQRIASELHDSVCQLLTSSNIRLEALKHDKLPLSAVESIDKIGHIIEECLKQTRSLIFGLSCPILKEFGLCAALEELCSSMSTEHAVIFEFVSNAETLPIAMDQQIVLYRFVRELMNNVVKHSKAETAHINVVHEMNRLLIYVEDNGIGFDAQTAGRGFSCNGGFGLFNLSEYIQHANGTMAINSTPENGTQISLMLPLENS